jgi:hypothetical protein
MIGVSFEVLGVGPTLWSFGVANTEKAKAESISDTRSRLDDESAMTSVGPYPVRCWRLELTVTCQVVFVSILSGVE